MGTRPSCLPGLTLLGPVSRASSDRRCVYVSGPRAHTNHQLGCPREEGSPDCPGKAGERVEKSEPQTLMLGM